MSYADDRMAMTTIQNLMMQMATDAAEREAVNRAAGKFCDFDSDLTVTGDWDWAKEDWTRYIGPRLQAVWNTLPSDIRHLIAEDFEERASRDWSDGIDAMGEDA